jgi:molybdopterin-guanine dinucleotide biosynthesis protein A
MDLIILASGTSSRFLRAGYQRSKYLLPFLGHSIIDRLRGMKGIDTIRIVHNREDMCSPDLQLAYSYAFSMLPVSTTTVDAHKLGPVHSLEAIIDVIDPDRPYAVTYCDYVASSFLNVDALRFEGDEDAIALTYSGFHPHHVFPASIYGYLKLNAKGQAVDYLEKASFTDNRMEEPCSAGLYLFRSGRIMLDAIDHVVANSRTYAVNGELYVSMLLKSMIDRSLTVGVRNTDYFAQLGTPEDYEDHVVWASCARRLITPGQPFYSLRRNTGICLVLMSGEGLRFSREGYTEHKAFLEIESCPILQHLIEALPAFPHYAFSVARSRPDIQARLEKFIADLGINGIVIPIDIPNGGQADSALRALSYLLTMDGIDPDQPVYIAPCDSVLRYQDPFLSMLDQTGFGVVLGDSNPFARLNPQSYSYAFTNIPASGGMPHVLELSVKQRPEADRMPEANRARFVTGAFYAHSLRDLEAILRLEYNKLPNVNGERYLDNFFSEICDQGKVVTAEIAEIYHSLGTPLEFRTSLYWNSFVKAFAN